MGHLNKDTTEPGPRMHYWIREGALPFHSWSGMAGWCGGRERSIKKREVLYPGEWQLPTSGRSSGEAFPVVVAAEAAVVPGVFVPLVSWPWPAGGLGASRCASASPSLPGGEAAGSNSEDAPVAERAEPLLDCKLRLPGNGLGPGGGREEEKPHAVVLPRWPGPARRALRRRLRKPELRVGT